MIASGFGRERNRGGQTNAVATCPGRGLVSGGLPVMNQNAAVIPSSAA
jgi:hypothetical protein